MNARMHDNPGQRDMYIFFADQRGIQSAYIPQYRNVRWKQVLISLCSLAFGLSF